MLREPWPSDPELTSYEAFASWLSTNFDLPADVEEHTPLDALPCLDGFARFAVFSSLERGGGSEFPSVLIEVIETVGDLYYFAQVKSAHRDR